MKRYPPYFYQFMKNEIIENNHNNNNIIINPPEKEEDQMPTEIQFIPQTFTSNSDIIDGYSITGNYGDGNYYKVFDGDVNTALIASSATGTVGAKCIFPESKYISKIKFKSSQSDQITSALNCGTDENGWNIAKYLRIGAKPTGEHEIDCGFYSNDIQITASGNATYGAFNIYSLEAFTLDPAPQPEQDNIPSGDMVELIPQFSSGQTTKDGVTISGSTNAISNTMWAVFDRNPNTSVKTVITNKLIFQANILFDSEVYIDTAKLTSGRNDGLKITVSDKILSECTISQHKQYGSYAAGENTVDVKKKGRYVSIVLTTTNGVAGGNYWSEIQLYGQRL